MTERQLQPLLHELVGVVLAPTSALGDRAGQIRPAGAEAAGQFGVVEIHADARVLSRAELRIDGREPEALTHGPDGPHGARFVGLTRWLGDPGPDPTVRVERARRADPHGVDEEISVVSTAAVPVRATVSVDLGCDLAPIEAVKSGGAATPIEARTGQPGRVRWAADGILPAPVYVNGREFGDAYVMPRIDQEAAS